MEDQEMTWATQLKRARQQKRGTQFDDAQKPDMILGRIDTLGVQLQQSLAKKDMDSVEDIFSKMIDLRARLAAKELEEVNQNAKESDDILERYAHDCARLAYAIDQHTAE